MKNKAHKNLAHIIHSFGFRPNLLAKYFIDNDVLKPAFLKVLEEGDYSDLEKSAPVFSHFSQIRDYYSDVLKTIDLNLDDENLTHKLNEKLDELIIQERYEEAIAIRDFMTIKKIPRNSGSI